MMNDSKKCNGYESMFVFLNDEDFAKHLSECPSCQIEHDKMQKLSNLINEVKPNFKKTNDFHRIVACISLFFVVGLSLPVCTVGVDTYENYVVQNTMSAEDIGFPVDEYGLIYFE